MRRHGAKNADYRGGVTCLYDTQLLGTCLHASESGGRSRPEAVRGMPDVPIAPPATGPPEGWARVMKSCPGACSSLIPDLLRIWACRRLVSAVIVLTRRASLRTISRRHAHGIAPRLRGWFRRSVSRPWPQGSGPTR